MAIAEQPFATTSNLADLINQHSVFTRIVLPATRAAQAASAEATPQTPSPPALLCILSMQHFFQTTSPALGHPLH